MEHNKREARSVGFIGRLGPLLSVRTGCVATAKHATWSRGNRNATQVQVVWYVSRVLERLITRRK